MVWGLVIVFLVGLAFGYFAKGATDKSRLFLKAFLWGVGISLVIALLGFFLGVDPLGLVGMGVLGIVINIFVLTIVFVGGVWLGDVIEGRREHRGARRV